MGEWFKKRLYSLGRVIKKLETISREYDWGGKVGIGYSVEAKKEKINIGRYLLHLLLIIEAKDRAIENLQKEVLASKQTYFNMETIISDLVNDENISSEIKDKFSKFYWLVGDKDED